MSVRSFRLFHIYHGPSVCFSRLLLLDFITYITFGEESVQVWSTVLYFLDDSFLWPLTQTLNLRNSTVRCSRRTTLCICSYFLYLKAAFPIYISQTPFLRVGAPSPKLYSAVRRAKFELFILLSSESLSYSLRLLAQLIIHILRNSIQTLLFFLIYPWHSKRYFTSF